jgi:hypothetical protein
MANVYQSQGKYEEALDFYQKSLAVLVALLGEQHPSSAMAYEHRERLQ